MKQPKNLLLALFIICSYSSFGQWTEINNIEGQFIETFNFLDDNLGYILTQDEINMPTIMKTVDGGNNWTVINLPMSPGELHDIYFYTEGQGVVAVRNLSNDLAPSMVFQTIDNGENWENISPKVTATGVGVSQCQFLSQDIGFFATDRFLYTTTDGGMNWTSQEFNEYILSIDFIDEEHGILGTWDGTFNYSGGILTTSDGGLTWTNNLLNETYTSIGKVQQLSTNIALAAPVRSWAAANTTGQIHKTVDNGISWTTIAIPTTEEGFTLRQVHFKDEMNGVVCVGNTTTAKVYQTIDGGQNWIEEGIVSPSSDMDMQITANSGYISGEIGSFYKRYSSTAVKDIRKKVDVNLFPSPVKAGQTIGWNSPETFTQLLIINSSGVIIHQEPLKNNYASLPQLASGVYFVQLLNERQFSTTKLIIE